MVVKGFILVLAGSAILLFFPDFTDYHKHPYDSLCQAHSQLVTNTEQRSVRVRLFAQERGKDDAPPDIADWLSGKIVRMQ